MADDANQVEVKRRVDEWRKKNAAALDELTAIQLSCRHLKKKYLGRDLCNIWEQCDDCDLLLVHEELPDIFDLV